MKSVDFSNQRKRLKHANEKAAELGVAIRQWADKRQYSFEPKISDDRLSWSLYLRVSEKPPVDDWGFMFGESIQHLRSVLDNLIVTIAESERQLTPKEKRTLYFPISSSATEWNKSKSGIALLSDKYQKAIENIQPYQRINESGSVDQDPLLLLQELNNKDKHHIQIVPELHQQEIIHGAGVEFYTEEDAKKNIPSDVTMHVSEFTDGALLLEQKTKSKISKVHGNINIKLRLQVERQGGNFIELTYCFGGLCYYTGVVLEYIAAVK